MKIGTYYYPEQWPRQQWERDFDNIAKMGLQIVHMAEFAWYEMEPKPGEFKFDWLSHCLDLAAKRKLDVILCTPTAAPPIWLSDGSPETLPMYEGNVRGRFGGRRHYNPLSPEFQAATRRIVQAMADRFGDHPSVIGWQIDNEYSNPFDQSEITHAAFRKWLREKYGDIQNLNRAWGNQFWNTYYTDFNQILLPPRAIRGMAIRTRGWMGRDSGAGLSRRITGFRAIFCVRRSGSDSSQPISCTFSRIAIRGILPRIFR